MKKTRVWWRKGRRTHGFLCFGVAAGAVGAFSTHAQEAMRMSLASEEAAEARREAAKLGYCNLQMGSVTARVQASLGLEMSDNIQYTTTKEADVAIRPGALIKSLWPITDLNSLYLSTGVGYIKYLRHSDLDSFYITPDSALTFQMYSGDFVFNLHDRFSWTEAGGQTPSINSANGYGRIANTAGATVDWDLNDVILSAGYDHDFLYSTKKQYDFVTHNSELVLARATYLLSSHLRAGLEAGGGYTYYDSDRFPTSRYFSGGSFVEANLSKFLKTRLSVGYVDYSFSPSLAGRSSLDSYYARWTVDHQATKSLRQSLSLQHNLAMGEWYAVGNIDSVVYTLNWSANKRLNFIGAMGYYNGDSYVPQKEKLSWFGPYLSCDYKIGPKLTASVVYSYSKLTANSSLISNAYDQNRLALTLTYTF